jgi:hypothetical protein
LVFRGLGGTANKLKRTYEGEQTWTSWLEVDRFYHFYDRVFLGTFLPSFRCCGIDRHWNDIGLQYWFVLLLRSIRCTRFDIGLQYWFVLLLRSIRCTRFDIGLQYWFVLLLCSIRCTRLARGSRLTSLSICLSICFVFNLFRYSRDRLYVYNIVSCIPVPIYR